jgi:puromycin-sensitive aminopeptidase
MKQIERLLDLFKPEHYKLFVHPDKERQTFYGTVEIRGNLTSPTSIIKLHASGLKIEKAKFSIGAGDHTFVNHKHGDHDILYLVSPIELQGEITVSLTFMGQITESMVGLYPCNFMEGSQEKQILATQFESHHAREVFPCIDEPAAKATFDVALKTLNSEIALSNTNQIEQTIDQDGWKITNFASTPKMSTYLLAFVIGELKSLEAKTSTGILVRTWATSEHIEYTRFALEFAVKTLEFFTDYFGMEYPLAKCDQVALPDFAAGAMENWGLITYRESVLLDDENNTSLSSRQAVALTVAHEIAHQWFGNLVTMQWWTDLWLNESFATWIEYKAVDHYFPEWKIWDQFVSGEYLSAQALDRLESTHPIEIEIENPDDIRSIFDAISYNKGASVIRMLHDYLGPDDFKHGLRNYLNLNSYANATTADLWSALEEISHKPIADYMGKWTKLAGFPMVSADFSDNSIDLKQQRFLINPNPQSQTESELWPIIINSTQSDDSFELFKAQDNWQTKSNKIIKLNNGQTGFYLVSYDPKHLVKLTIAIQSGDINPLDRLGLLSDVWQLAKAGHHPTVAALKLLDVFDREENAVVWDVMASQLGGLRSVIDTEELSSSMDGYIADLIKLQLSRLGWDERAEDSHFDKLLRPLILGLAGMADVRSVVIEAKRQFDSAAKPQDIKPDIRGVVMGIVAKSGSTADYEKIKSMYMSSKSSQVKDQLSAGLCGFKQSDLIQKSLDLITSDAVRLQEVIYWVSYLFANRYAKLATWQWLKQHWSWLMDRFGTDIMTVSYFPKIVGRSFSTQKMIDEYDQFFSNVNISGIDLPIKQGRESIQWHTAWRNRDESEVLRYFKTWPKQSNSNEAPTTPKSTDL